MKRSTIVSIAKQLNISTATVSRALNNKGNVKESTRERVLEAAREFNYIPNQLARSLQNAKTNTIAVVIPDITEDFFGNITAQIDHVVSRDKFMLLVCDTHENATLEKKYLDMLHERRVDAIVLATVDLTGNTSRRIRESGIPIVYIDNIPSCEEIKSITIDNQLASHIAVDYLFEKGHRKIAGIFGSQEETTGCERYRGYIGALSEHDLSKDLNLIEFGDYKYASGYRCMKNLLSNEKMTAVFCGLWRQRGWKKTFYLYRYRQLYGEIDCKQRFYADEKEKQSDILTVHGVDAQTSWGFIPYGVCLTPYQAGTMCATRPPHSRPTADSLRASRPPIPRERS